MELSSPEHSSLMTVERDCRAFTLVVGSRFRSLSIAVEMLALRLEDAEEEDEAEDENPIKPFIQAGELLLCERKVHCWYCEQDD